MSEPLQNESVETKYSSENFQNIENARQDFLKLYKRHNTLKWVVTVICMVLIVIAFIVVPNLIKENSSTVVLAIAVVALAGTFLYSTWVRKNMDRKMKDYFKLFFTNMNEYALKQEGFDKVELQEPGKIDVKQFNECNLYKDVYETGSRGLTEFEYNSIPMAIVDCAGNVKLEKRIAPAFVGKYLYAPCSYLKEEMIVVYLKGNDRALPPTNLDGLEVVEDNAKLKICTNNSGWKKVLTADVMNLINQIETNKNLIDLAISMHDGKIHVLMGYDDPLMVLPLQNEFDAKPYEMYKEDITKIVRVVEALNK